MATMFSKPKKPKIDTSAQDEAAARARAQDEELKKKEAASSRLYAGRNQGRGLLLNAGTGDAGVGSTPTTLG